MKRLLPLLIYITALSSCTAEIDQLNTGARKTLNKTPVFYATAESSSVPDTKTFADSQMRVLWNAGDQISIFNRISYGLGFEFDGDDGDSAGGFYPFTELPSFGSWGDLDYVYAVYPYNTKNKSDYDGNLTVTLPTKQLYKQNSFGIGANTMVAVSEGSRLQFKNIGGYLSLRLYGDNVKVKSITIKGNNGEKIAGKATVTIPFGGTPTTVMDESATDAITISCEPAVQLGTDATHYTDFWFVIPPVTFTNGFKITVTDDQGGVFEKTTTSSLAVVRNQLDWMDPLEVETEHIDSGTVTSDDLECLYQATIQVVNVFNRVSGHASLTYNDSTMLFQAFRDFSELRESCLKYVFNPATESRDRRYFKYCLGYDSNYNPVIDSIKFTDITLFDIRNHRFDLTTTRLDNYDEGDVVGSHPFKSISLQLFNASIADLFRWYWDEWLVDELIDIETAINADNYYAYFGCYRFDAFLGTIIPLDDSEYETMPIHFEDAMVKTLCLSNWDDDGDGEISIGEAANIESIGTVFRGKQITKFNELRFFSGLTSIEAYAFCDCNKLTSITLPSRVTSIGDGAFSNCSSLSGISFPSELTNIGAYSFSGCSLLTSITLPTGVECIGANAFAGCGKLRSIDFSANLTSIGASAFEVCLNLTNIVFPSGLTSIGNKAFFLCSNLRSIDLPSSLTSIGDNAFSRCASLTDILVRPITPPIAGEAVFNGSTCNIQVPSSSVGTYKSANGWNIYAERIVGNNYL